MRQVILDTETTGLEPEQGHRIIEVGCVELNNRRRSKRQLQHYLNPGREIEGSAFNIHGISSSFLADKPKFSAIAQELIDFIRDSELIIHNAPFDIAFLNAELRRTRQQLGKIEDYCQITDTLVLARKRHPGQKNSLDTLCKRYGVDNTQRELHGALLDAHILADVYLVMTGGQTALSFTEENKTTFARQDSDRKYQAKPMLLPVIQASAEEQIAHQKRLEQIQHKSGGHCIWLEKKRDIPIVK